MFSDPVSLEVLCALLRDPVVADRPVRTAGELAALIEDAYKARYYRPAPPQPRAKPVPSSSTAGLTARTDDR